MKQILLAFLLFPFALCAQNDSTGITEIYIPKKERKKMEFAGVYKSTISLELGGKSGYVGVAYDHLLSRRWRIGLGVGYPGAGAEVKCFPFGVQRDKLLFNIGTRATAFFPVNGSDYMFYSVPLGLSFFTLSRVNLELDAGPLFKVPFNAQETGLTGFGNAIDYVWVSIKVGYRFSFYAIRRARQLNASD